jgi:hypothetical protein
VTWPKLRAALLMRIQMGRAVSLHLRGRVALAAAESAGPRRERLRRVLRDARLLEAEDMPWIDPLAALLRAGLAQLQGRPDAALDALARGEAGARAVELRLYAAAARRQRGRLLGGDDGRALIADADTIFAAEGVVRPDRFAGMLVPGFGAR